MIIKSNPCNCRIGARYSRERSFREFLNHGYASQIVLMSRELIDKHEFELGMLRDRFGYVFAADDKLPRNTFMPEEIFDHNNHQRVRNKVHVFAFDRIWDKVKTKKPKRTITIVLK